MMQLTKQEQLAKFQCFLKTSVFSNPGATLNGVQMIKCINVNEHCLSYVSWVFLRVTFNYIQKLVYKEFISLL